MGDRGGRVAGGRRLFRRYDPFGLLPLPLLRAACAAATVAASSLERFIVPPSLSFSRLSLGLPSSVPPSLPSVRRRGRKTSRKDEAEGGRRDGSEPYLFLVDLFRLIHLLSRDSILPSAPFASSRPYRPLCVLQALEYLFPVHS